MSYAGDSGFRSVLSNSHFRNLWASQAINQTAQHSIHFVQMILVEQLTGSSTQLGVVILAFTLPGVIFSPLAGVVVDRWPKKWILVGSNLLRAILVGGYLLALATLHGLPLLLTIYALTFVTSAIAQFFGPAEGAIIPMLVGETRLLAANSIFSLTLAASQVAGLIVLGPLIVKLVGFNVAFLTLMIAYAIAAALVSKLPRDHRGSLDLDAAEVREEAASQWQQIRADLREGWHFVATNRVVLIPVMQLAMTSALVMIMATLAPGFASRVLGMQPEDAVFVFAPAGVGMLAATTLLGRFGYRLRKDVASYIFLAIAALGFALLGLVSRGFDVHKMPIFEVFPHWAITVTSAIMGISLILGLAMSAANILATTLVQENTPAHIRGRVFALQFMLNTGLGIIPMLIMAAVADIVGIPRVLLGIAVVILVLTALAFLLSLGIPKVSLPGRALVPADKPEREESLPEADTEQSLPPSDLAQHPTTPSDNPQSP